MSENTKDLWDKIDIIMKPLGGLLTAAAISLLGILGSGYLEKRQSREVGVRLYTELISKREASENELRKDMFSEILKSFLEPQATTLNEKILKIELLGQNFHETLNIAPLFKYLEGLIHKDKSLDSETRKSYWKRLIKIAKEITYKQISTLEEAENKKDFHIELNERLIAGNGRSIKLKGDHILTLGENKKKIKLSVLAADTATKEIKVRLSILQDEESASPEDVKDVSFWVGFFDFPMIDNVRLPNDERCSVVMRNFEYPRAEITVIYFSGSRAGLKTKPYYQSIIEDLLPKS